MTAAAKIVEPEQPEPGPGPGIDDQELVVAAQRGERGAFDALVQLHQQAIFAFAWRRVGDVEAARELTQQTLVRAYEALRSFRAQARFRTWLFSIAVRLCLDAQRRRPEPVFEDAQHAPDAPVLLQERERAIALRRAVAQLPEKQRLVVELRAFEELPFKEIGAVLEMSEESAKTNFHHALRRLRSELGDQHE